MSSNSAVIDIPSVPLICQAFGCLFVAGLIAVSTAVGLAISANVDVVRLKTEAIERGVARHNPETGYWEWTVEPVKPKAESEPK